MKPRSTVTCSFANLHKTSTLPLQRSMQQHQLLRRRFFKFNSLLHVETSFLYFIEENSRNNPRYEESTILTSDASTLFYSMFSIYGVYGIYVWISRGLALKTEESSWIGRKGSIASRNVEDEHETTCTRRRALVPESSGSHCAGEQLPPFVSSFFLLFLATLAPLLSPTDDTGPT